MTKYKKFVKKRSLRYKNCKTHRRKGRKAGAGGTWHQKIRNFLGSRRARIHIEKVPFRPLPPLGPYPHERAAPPPLPPPRPPDGQSQSVFYYRSPRPDDPVSDWRDYGPIDTAISNISLIRLAGGIADAMDTLSEKLNSKLTKDLEKSNSTELYEKYIDLLDTQYTNLESLKELVDNTSYFDKQPLIARKLKRYEFQVGKITALEHEITALEDEIIKTTAEIDTSMRPIPSYDDVLGRPYGNNSDNDDD